MTAADCLVVIPVYGHWDYAEKAIRSAKIAGAGAVYVVDDAGPEATPRLVDYLWKETWFTRRPKNLGMTAAWNDGLNFARGFGTEPGVVVLGNSDLIFAPTALDYLARAAEEFDLVGPLTNAPGTNPQQYVGEWLDDYAPSDEPECIATVANMLHGLGTGKIESLNGFCLAAKLDRWWSGAYDDKHVFNPKHINTFSEYELQRRWRKMGRLCGVAKSAFVLHYRSVTRGNRYTMGQAYRPHRAAK